MQIIRNNTVRRLALGIAAAAAVVPAFGATAANADTGGLGPRTVTEGGTAYFAATLQCTAANARGGECAYRYKTMPDTAKVDNSGPATKDYNPFAILSRAIGVGETWVARFEVKTINDTRCENDEWFWAEFTVNDVQHAIGRVTIKDNDCKKLRRVPRPCTNADTLVTQLTAEQAEAAVLCLTNEKRRRHGVPALTRNANLATSARRHADNSVARRWWDATDGNVSHDDPEIPNEPNTTNDIGVRIRAAGYCPNPRSWANSENTFSAARGTPQTDVARAIYPPTPRGAVEWWYTHLGPDGTVATNDHRRTMLNPLYRELGVGVARGSAFPADTGAVAAGTFVQNYGSCT